MRATGTWSGGLAEWTEGNTAYLSIAFSWRLPDAFSKAVFYAAQKYRVVAGGPGMAFHLDFFQDLAEVPTKMILSRGKLRRVPGDFPDNDAVRRHNAKATFASRGCPVNCSFCTVPVIEGEKFTVLPDFPVRPVLCDNNLSALPPEYQDHIISRYKAEGVPLLDANSGFEPRTFCEEVYQRWKPINKGPWRFAYDDQGDGPHVERVMKMLADEQQRRKRVYVLIGNEPMASCLERVNRVIAWGGEPHCQPEIKLNALEKSPAVRFDWTAQALKDMARWANGRFWKYTSFEDYRGPFKTVPRDPDQMDFETV